MKKKTRTPSTPVRTPAAERSIELLLCIAGQQGSASLQELTERMGFSKSTVHRLLGRLERIGVAERDPQSRRYRSGPRLRNAMREGWNEFDPRRLALPLMEKLRDETGETVILHLRDGLEHVVVEKCEGASQIRRVIPLGHRWPIFRGATARAILAFLSDDQAKTILASSASHPDTKRGAAPPSPAELRAVRKQGFAVSLGEITTDVTAAAAPVFDHRGTVWGGISVSGPTYRFTRADAMRTAPALKRAAAEISAAFGHAPPRNGTSSGRGS